MSRLIGLCGAARSGKDTVGSILEKRGYATTSFAAPIRGFVCELLGITLDMLEIQKESPTYLGKSPRQMMQTLGTEWGRELVNDDIWILRAMAGLKGDTVITDVRFDNEAEAIIAKGGEVWKVERGGVETIADASHKSEGGVSSKYISRVITNNFSLAYLESEVLETKALMEKE